MKPEELKPYVDFMEAYDLLILSVENPDVKLYLAKKGAEGLISSATATKVSGAIPAKPTEEISANENIVSVTSPLVGIFYRASAPGATPYVEEGQEVSVDDTLCIVDAMKSSNFIKSEADGKILKISVENAAPVEFGQVLFLIEKS